MQLFYYSIDYIKEKQNSVANTFSRMESKVQKVPSEILKKPLTLTAVSVRNKSFKNMKSDYENNKILNSFLYKPEICTESYAASCAGMTNSVFLKEKLDLESCATVMS